MSAPSTVVEFAAKYCADCGDGTAQQNIQSHVDMIIEAATASGRTLWKVAIDDEGRASLLWASLPEAEWEALLREGVTLAAIKRKLGLA